MAASKKPSDSGNFQRSLRVLECVAESDTPLRFADLEKQLGYPKATLNRLLGQLLETQMLMLDERSQCYALGFRLLALARKSWARMDLRRLAHQPLVALAERTQESVQLAIQSDIEMVYVDCVESNQSVRLSVRVGDRVPIYCSSTGKALLAFRPAEERRELIQRIRFAAITPQTLTSPKALLEALGPIRQQGYAIDREEHFVGVWCVASPIVDASGSAIAALSVAAPSFRVDEQRLQDWAQAVSQTARDISACLPPH